MAVRRGDAFEATEDLAREAVKPDLNSHRL